MVIPCHIVLLSMENWSHDRGLTSQHASEAGEGNLHPDGERCLHMGVGEILRDVVNKRVVHILLEGFIVEYERYVVKETR